MYDEMDVMPSSPVSELVELLRAVDAWTSVDVPNYVINLTRESADRLTALDAENAKLRKALEPLKRIADAVFYIDEDFEMNASRDDADNVWGFDNAYLTYGDLRAARAILSTAQQGGDHAEG